MDRLLYVETDEFQDQFGITRLQIPLSRVDLSYNGLTEQVRGVLLTLQYWGDYLEDGLQTGHVKLDKLGKASFQSRVSLATYLGFALEAYVVRRLNEPCNSTTIKRDAIMWCSHRAKTNQGWINEYTAIGTGLKNTQQRHIHFYLPGDTSDVRFVRTKHNKKTKQSSLEPLVYLENKTSAGIQIKAINGNERNEVINPLLSGKYSCVLTMLGRPNHPWYHSYHECMSEVQKLFDAGVIGYDDKISLQKRICRPADLGFDEYDIRNYVEYISRHFPNFDVPDPTLVATANIEISRAFMNKDNITGTDALTRQIIVEE